MEFFKKIFGKLKKKPKSEAQTTETKPIAEAENGKAEAKPQARTLSRRVGGGVRERASGKRDKKQRFAPITEGEEIPEGLSSADVERLKAEGKANVVREKHGKSYLKIITDNLFTFFNLIWTVIAVLLVITERYTNMTFLLIVIPNMLIAIIQEARAKAAVERLSVTTDPKATVVRDGTLIDIGSKEIVLGDVMKLEVGRQILSDAVVISGICEVNESMITGESVAVKKHAGDKLLAGSFLVSGCVFARVEKVGKDNYIHTLEKEAKKFSAPSSNMFRDLNRLIKSIGVTIIPMATISALINWFHLRTEAKGMELFAMVVEKTCGSVIGMIPAGIYLLVTLTLSLSVVKLARKKTLVQDMYSIEMLASADVICLDKTGTITDGTMRVCEVESIDGTERDEIARIMSYLDGAEGSQNATSKALTIEFGRSKGHARETVPFSSERKYSAVDMEEIGCYAIGAPGFVPCEVSDELNERIVAHASEGRRVLLLVRLPALTERGDAVALIAIEDRIRPNAKETIARFQEQGVAMKVISGDHAATVSNIAKKVGILGAERYISCENLTNEELVMATEEYSVFGRVTPEQKVLIIKTLRKNGHIVAMTGDGVNDTLALKESNCAIAMADGSEVARKISSIVLLNSDFGTLPDVVKEGRRCINNVRQSAVLYLMKTVFTILTTLASWTTLSSYPLSPNQLLFLELFVIGVASVLLALEPNDKRIKGSFMDTVIVKSIPCAIAMFIPTLIIMVISRFASTDWLSQDCRNAVAMCVVIIVGFLNLVFICRPFTKWRVAVVSFVAMLLGAATAVANIIPTDIIDFGFRHVLDNRNFFIGMLVVCVVSAIVMNLFRSQLEEGVIRFRRRQEMKAKGAMGAKRSDQADGNGSKKRSVKRGARHRRVEYIGFDEDWVPVRRHKDEAEEAQSEEENTSVGN